MRYRIGRVRRLRIPGALCLSLAGWSLAGWSGAAWAQSAATTALGGESIRIPGSGFFAGISVGLNSVNFGHQSIYAIGTSRNYQNGAVVSAGTAAGPGGADPATAITASPEIRLGYYSHIGASPWIWGFRTSYQDLLADETLTDVGIPQSGVIAYAGSQTLQPFTGVAVVQTYRVQADSRFGAMPFIGRDIGPGFLYLGLGGSMTHATTAMDGLVGYATVNGQTQNVSGAPQNFSSSGWVMGAGITVGGSFFITHDWFLDIAYSFDETAAQVGRYVSSFTNSSTNPGITTVGNLYGQSSERIITNGLTVTINRKF